MAIRNVVKPGLLRLFPVAATTMFAAFCGSAHALDTCTVPTWTSGKYYLQDAKVRYTPNNKTYRALVANPVYAPTASTSLWQEYTCVNTTVAATGACRVPDWVAGRYYLLDAKVRYVPNGKMYRALRANPKVIPGTNSLLWAEWNCNQQPAPAPAPAPLTRSMWVWDDEDIATTQLQDAMLNVAVSHKMNVISVHAPGLLMERPAVLATFINRAAARQIKVELLFGQPTWMFAANHQQALNHLARANNFVRTLTGAKPVGVHFDVEPHVLPDWDANRASYGNQLIDLYVKMQAARLPELHLNVDMALGYRDVAITRNGVTKSLSHWLVDTVDRTTIMSYRDFAFGPDSIIYHASHPVDYAATKGKRVMVSVETICGLEPEKITFCEEGLAEMNAAIDSVYANYRSNTGFGGMSIHDYRNLKRLQ